MSRSASESKDSEYRKTGEYAFLKYFPSKNHNLIKTWLTNVVIFDTMLRHNIEDDLFDEIRKPEATASKPACWFAYDGHPESRVFSIIGTQEILSPRTSEVAKIIYQKSKLKDLVTYSVVSSPLRLAVKANFILYDAGSSPIKKFVKRINELLEVFKEERVSRETSLELIVERVIYLSLFPEYMVRELPRLESKSLGEFPGGKSILVRLDRGFDKNVSESSRGRWIRLFLRYVKNRRRLRKYKKMGLFHLRVHRPAKI